MYCLAISLGLLISSPVNILAVDVLKLTSISITKQTSIIADQDTQLCDVEKSGQNANLNGIKRALYIVSKMMKPSQASFHLESYFRIKGCFTFSACNLSMRSSELDLPCFCMVDFALITFDMLPNFNLLYKLECLLTFQTSPSSSPELSDAITQKY